MRLLVTGTLLLAITAVTSAATWPQFRGPTGQGHASAKRLPTTFSETKNVAWRTKIPGRGWSSPVVEGDQIWVTTAIDKKASSEDIKKRLAKNTGSQPLIVSESVSLFAVCVDAKSGKMLHNIKVLERKNPQWVHELNSYASPTPIIEDGRLYCHFGALGTACVDTATGKVLWTNIEHHVMHENGPGGSPELVGDSLIFHCDGSDKQFIAALDKKSGKTIWTTPRSGKMNKNPQLQKAYGTPLVATFNGVTQVLSQAADWLYSYDAATGKELWRVGYETLGFSNVSRAVTGHGMVFLSTSFMRPQLLAIQVEGVSQPKVVWRYTKRIPAMTSPILVGNELYTVADKGGYVTCLNAKTGDVHYVESLRGNFCASPLHAAGKIYFFSREGDCTVIKAGTKFEVLAKNSLDGTFMASPAVIGDAMFLRTDKALYRIEAK